jgi:hypothetical protein
LEPDHLDRGPFHYRADVLELLWRHGVRPSPRTRPELVREFVRDLYRYEIRVLRGRMLRREFPKSEYAGRVETLRRRYPVLRLLPRQLVDPAPALQSGRMAPDDGD